MCREADAPTRLRKAVREQIKSGGPPREALVLGGSLYEEIHSCLQFTVDEIRAAVEEAPFPNGETAVHALPEQAIQNCLKREPIPSNTPCF